MADPAPRIKDRHLYDAFTPHPRRFQMKSVGETAKLQQSFHVSPRSCSFAEGSAGLYDDGFQRSTSLSPRGQTLYGLEHTLANRRSALQSQDEACGVHVSMQCISRISAFGGSLDCAPALRDEAPSFLRSDTPYGFRIYCLVYDILP